MKHNYKFESTDLVLKPMEQNDNEKYRELRNIHRDCFFDNSIISRDQQNKWYSNYCKKDGEYMFTILDKEGGYIGGCGIYGIKDNTAEFGRIVVNQKGSGTKTCTAISELAKDILKLKELRVFVKENNERALKCYGKSGFKYLKCDNGIIEMVKLLQ